MLFISNKHLYLFSQVHGIIGQYNTERYSKRSKFEISSDLNYFVEVLLGEKKAMKEICITKTLTKSLHKKYWYLSMLKKTKFCEKY